MHWFESLESRQMLNAAPVAIDDTYTTSEDKVLTVGGSLPGGIVPVKWNANGHFYAVISSAAACCRSDTGSSSAEVSGFLRTSCHGDNARRA